MSAALWVALAVQAAQAPLPGPRIGRVTWLQGCWAAQEGDRTVEEQWLAPRASSMLGVARTTHGSMLTDYEMMLIRERGDRLSYEAHPSNQEPAVFMSTVVGDRSIEFENLKHDFPQRVGYRRVSRDRLLAWIEGPQGARTRHIDFTYERVPCAGE